MSEVPQRFDPEFIMTTLDPVIIWDRIVELIAFPVTHPEYVTSLMPLAVGLVVIEFYFGRYEGEELGWNSAVSNSALLIATGLSLVYELRILNVEYSIQFYVAYGILGMGAIILGLNFFHLWPARIAFHLSSAFITYMATYLAIATVYIPLPFDNNTGTAAVTVFIATYFLFHGLKIVEQSVLPGGTSTE